MLRVTATTQLMKEIVELLSVVTDEAKMSWGENGVTVIVVDGGMVSMLSATISDACFETYECEPVIIGMELGKMKDLLTLAGPSDLVEIEYDDAVGTISVRVGQVHRLLRGLDTNTMKDSKTPRLKWQEYGGATIDSEKFSRSLRAAKLVGELVDFRIDSKSFGVSVEVEAGEGVNVSFESGELIELAPPPPPSPPDNWDEEVEGVWKPPQAYDGTANGTYSLQYLDPLSRKIASGLANDVQVRFRDGHPLRLDWSSNEGGASWAYFLAPRVTNE